jgi:hypothetical protein
MISIEYMFKRESAHAAALLHPELVRKAWDYFNNVQTKDVKYKSFLRPDDKPAIWLNQKPWKFIAPG